MSAFFRTKIRSRPSSIANWGASSRWPSTVAWTTTGPCVSANWNASTMDQRVPPVSRFHRKSAASIDQGGRAPPANGARQTSWDSSVDPLGRSPLRPLEKGTELIDGCRQVFGKVHPDLEGMFNILVDGDPSTSNLARARHRVVIRPVSMRSEALHLHECRWQTGDVETLLHEEGTFHSIEARDHSLIANRSAPIEYCEVASMAMELLGAPTSMSSTVMERSNPSPYRSSGRHR